MKVKYRNFAGNVRDLASINYAVASALTPDAYSYEGQLEKLAGENEKLRELVSRLVECLYGEQKPKHEALEYILGYGYEVEE